MIEPEEIDLADLSERLRGSLSTDAREGYVVGKTALRDCVARFLNCSDAEAERLVETLIGRGLARFTGDPSSAAGRGYWELSGP